MVRKSKHPELAGCQGKKKIAWLLLWFVVYGFTIDAYSAAETITNQKLTKIATTHSNKGESKANGEEYPKASKNDEDPTPKHNALYRISRAVPSKTDATEPSKSSARIRHQFDYVIKIPLSVIRQFELQRILRHLRASEDTAIHDDKRNTIIPIPRFGRSDSILYDNDSFEENVFSKKYDTAIPMMRYGRKEYSKSNSNSVIPYPRLGRTLLEVKEMKNSDGNTENEYKTGGTEDFLEETTYYDENEAELENTLSVDQRHKKNVRDEGTIIPFPRPGRDDTKHSLTAVKKDTDYILPQIRYGRSMLLLSPKKTEGSTKENPSHTFVLPYPRPGRSEKYVKGGKSTSENLILPYPRPRRSKLDQKYTWLDLKKNGNGYMLPFARLGRSTLLLKSYSGAKKEIDGLEDGFLEKHILDNSGEKNVGGSMFVIPYPRPGKKSMVKIKNEKLKTGKADAETSDYVLPYPRPGKKSDKQKFSKMFDAKNKESNDLKSFVLPYPRPGRANEDLFGESFSNTPYSKLGDAGAMENKNSEISNHLNSNELLVIQPNEEYSITHNRLPERFGDLITYTYPEQFTDEFSHEPHGENYDVGSKFGIEQSTEPYDDDNDDSTQLRLKRSSAVVPNTGKFISVAPYPRLGRADFVVPYPRLGRSNSIVPYPRPNRSRSSSSIPYFSKKTDGVDQNSQPVNPSFVVPYPRPRRSDTVVPYPRLGRSDTVVPYPRLGRSIAVVPYPRPGRSLSVVPYPRPGRSLSVVPYPRLGRSHMESSDSLNKYLKTKNFSPKVGDSYIVPYPRPGRSENERDLINNDVFYDPDEDKDIKDRVDRSTKGQGYILPHPRIGRSNAQERDERETYDTDTVIPYPRLGRSQKETTVSTQMGNSIHKLNKHMLPNAGNSIYLLPYPRPGRSE